MEETYICEFCGRRYSITNKAIHQISCQKSHERNHNNNDNQNINTRHHVNIIDAVNRIRNNNRRIRLFIDLPNNNNYNNDNLRYVNSNLNILEPLQNSENNLTDRRNNNEQRNNIDQRSNNGRRINLPLRSNSINNINNISNDNLRLINNNPNRFEQLNEVRRRQSESLLRQRQRIDEYNANNLARMQRILNMLDININSAGNNFEGRNIINDERRRNASNIINQIPNENINNNNIDNNSDNNNDNNDNIDNNDNNDNNIDNNDNNIDDNNVNNDNNNIDNNSVNNDNNDDFDDFTDNDGYDDENNGITDDILKYLPENVLNEEDILKLNEDAKRCVICLEDYIGGDAIMRLPCFHFFHKDCISIWLKKNAKCPFCNLNIIENLDN